MKKIFGLKREIYKIIFNLNDNQLYELSDGGGGFIGVVGRIDHLLYREGGILDDIHNGHLEEWSAETANDKLDELYRTGSGKVGQWWWTRPDIEDDYTITIHIGGGLCLIIGDLKIKIHKVGF